MKLQTPSRATRLRRIVPVAMAVLAGCTSSATASKNATRTALPPTPSRAADVRTVTATGPIELSTLSGRIAFSAGPPHGEDVYVMDADGTNLIRVTTDPAADFDPTWSPDGTRIAYRHQPGDDLTTDIDVIGLDGSKSQNLTHDTDIPDWGPAWSPDGRRIVWNSDHDASGSFRGFFMSSDGSNVTPLGVDVWVEYPAWSPDGAKIAFMSQTPEGNENYEIFVANADGTGLRRLTRSPGPDGWPSWSPDGTKLLFSSVRDDCLYTRSPECLSTGDMGPFHTLYVMNADGSRPTRLSTEFGQIADWSPDGRFIVFEGSDGLSLVRADGTGMTALHTGLGFSGFPDWIP